MVEVMDKTEKSIGEVSFGLHSNFSTFHLNWDRK